MKRGTPDHPKTKEFAEALGVRRVTAVGYLELLFHFTANYAPAGDIGRFSDKRIAAGIDWVGKPDRLIAALKEAGFIESHPCHRLVIHDWHDHADTAVRKRLGRAKIDFVSPQLDSEKPTGHRETKTSHCLDNGSLARARMPMPMPMPTPTPEGCPDGDPEWDRLEREYPGVVKPDWDCQLFISLVETPEDHQTFWRNFALWMQTRQWRQGFMPNLGNFLESGQWKKPPPPEPERKSDRERLLESI